MSLWCLSDNDVDTHGNREALGLFSWSGFQGTDIKSSTQNPAFILRHLFCLTSKKKKSVEKDDIYSGTAL